MDGTKRYPEHYATVERGMMPPDAFGKAEIKEIEPPTAGSINGQIKPIRIRIDTVPQDSIALTLDAAVTAAIAMQSLSRLDYKNQLGFRSQYSAD